jgi:HK97 family phage prohead protease
MTGATLHHKQLAAVAIADPAVTAEGTFDAIVSVFDVVDSQGDRVVRGAFERTIKEWRASGDPVPVVFAHQWADASQFVGAIDPKDMEEVARGLRVKGRLFINESEQARWVFELMQKRLVREFSFGWNPYPGGERQGADGVTEISAAELYEVTVCLKGANPWTELLATKSADDAEHRPQRLHPRPRHTSEGQLRQRAEAAGLHLPWTERELRKASDAAVEEHVTLPTRALRRRSDEQRLEAAIGGRELPPTERQRRKRADRADAAEAYAREYSAMRAVLTAGAARERVD